MSSEAPSPPTRDLARYLPWLVRVLWAALPFTVGPALAAALDGASSPVRLVASAGLWIGWSASMIATFAPHPLALTALRFVAPAVVLAAVLAALGGHASPLALAWATVSCAWAFAPAVGATCVNGPAYPNERRYLLRPPGPLLMGPLPLAWAVTVAGIAAGPLLLAARVWVLGAITLLVGWPLAVLLLKSIHNLSRRWAVFVPAGMVLHDPLVLFDPLLFPRQDIAALRPAARRDPSYVDLSQRAPGLGVEMDLVEVATVTLLKPGRREGEPVDASRLRFTPTRPGAVIDEAHRRRIARP
ncbi:MAG TPA: hypothetical protein VHT97_02350 [Acidimicrobiales bacterium]|jgi:hypothetical protein|nr:hypothetical protein [Acidimicrobiales bacterium]